MILLKYLSYTFLHNMLHKIINVIHLKLGEAVSHCSADVMGIA